MSRRLAFLSTEDLTDFVCDDALAVPAFEARGASVQTVAWQAAADWASFDAVLIRSTWDYQRDPDRFLAVLADIELETRLFNPLEVVRWNIHKSYLVELADKGVPVVPTRLARGICAHDWPQWREAFGVSELVVKPAIGANADDAFRVPADLPEADLTAIGERYEGRDLLVQPFLRTVLEQGEHSLFFFGGKLSHAIQKVPKPGDFRVQEEHGGDIRPVPAPAKDLIAVARAALDAVGRRLVYARVDLVRDPSGQPRLMELELVEPALYFRTDPEASGRFADAVLRGLDTPDGEAQTLHSDPR